MKLKILFFAPLILFSAFLIFILFSLFILFDFTHLPQILKEPELLWSLLFTFKTSFISIFISFFISVPSAYAISQYKFPFKNFFEILIEIPIFLPPIITGLGLLIFFGRILKSPFESFSLNFIFNEKAVILAQITIGAPVLIKNLILVFSKVDKRYQFIARTLGANSFQAFLKVFIPISLKGIILSTVTAFSRILGEFGATLMFAGAITKKTETLPIAIFLKMQEGKLDLAISIAIIYIIIYILFILILRKALFENLLREY